MTISDIVAELDSEIERLQQARALLAESSAKNNQSAGSKPARKMSAAARKKISEGQRKRWARTKSKD